VFYLFLWIVILLIDVSLSTIAQKYASCFNGTHFFVGANIVYAHPSDMTTWYSVSNDIYGRVDSCVGFEPGTWLCLPSEFAVFGSR
jgi:hypothetical protein